jgi:homoserine dehydrogenase
MLAFGAKVDVDQVPVEGIRSIDQIDFAFAQRFGFTIKHLAIGREVGGKLALRAHPTLVPQGSVLANIDGVLNGVYVMGRALGPCLLVGPGAGDMPTAVSVVADIVDVARSRLEGEPGLATRAIRPLPREVAPLGQLRSRYYLRFDVSDNPGVLGVIASELGSHAVSTEQMVQEGREEQSAAGVQVLIITHRTEESGLQSALQSIATQSFMKAPPRLIRIEEV